MHVCPCWTVRIDHILTAHYLNNGLLLLSIQDYVFYLVQEN